MLSKPQLWFCWDTSWLPAWPGVKLARAASAWAGPGDSDPRLVLPGVTAGGHVAVLELLHGSGSSFDDDGIFPCFFPSP